MRKVISIAAETSILLRRDQIFQPLTVIVGAALAIAIFATDWSIEEKSSVYHNLVAFIFQISGSIISLIWGVKIISDAKIDGSIEQSMSRPVTRSQWLLGRFLGLAFTLFILSLAVGIVWRLGAYVYEIPTVVSWFTISLIQTLFLWLITGSVAVFVSTFAGPGTGLFIGASMWLLGLMSRPIAQGLSGPGFEGFKNFTTVISNFWSLSPFVPEAYGEIMNIKTRQVSSLYGLTVIVLLYFAGSMIARSKDVNS